MRIIFIKDFIVDDLFGIKVHAGRTGFLLDEVDGKVELDLNTIECTDKIEDVVYGIIEGVQPGTYIPMRD